MPFCKVYLSDIREDDPSFWFRGYFQEREGATHSTVYAAVKTTDPEFEECHSSFDVYDVRGGRALYAISDYLTIGSREFYDIAIYRHADAVKRSGLDGRNLNGLYGYLDTKSGETITTLKYFDVNPFYDERYAKVCYPDGRTEFIDAEGHPVQTGSFGDSIDVYDFDKGLFFANMRSTSGSIVCGAFDAGRKICIDYKWHTLSPFRSRNDYKRYVATKNGRYYVLDKQGEIYEDKGIIFDSNCEFDRLGVSYWWNITVKGNSGKLRSDGGVWLENENHICFPSDGT